MANVILDDTHLINIANAIREKNGEATTYTPGEMAEAITDLPSGGGGGEPIVLSGSCDYACYGQFASDVISQYGDTISTENISSAQNMFNSSTLVHIPFELNFNDSDSHSMAMIFTNCNYLEEAPVMNNVSPNSMNMLFAQCYRMRSLPEGFGLNWRWTNFCLSTSSFGASLFVNCYSLRDIPTYFLDNIKNKKTSSSGHPYNSTFRNCYVLEHIKTLGVATGTLTSNMFLDTFLNCSRLQEMTFELSAYSTDYGTWVVSEESWKNQTIDLSNCVGYCNSAFPTYITNYNSGITDATRITGDTTYQALKDNLDSWTTDVNYSRYNHDSAVNTINSLPDTHAYINANGGTNTIKFKGAAGALTDGGAINTLTEEEIAVATAKGWTVTLV